jgi:alpha-tubulin suppressor-like RCC1 family protein
LRVDDPFVCGGEAHSVIFDYNTITVFGGNLLGQLGDGSRTDRTIPIALRLDTMLNGATVSSVSCGRAHNGVLLSDGRVIMWGSDSNGQLGIGRELSRKSPYRIEAVTQSISAYPIDVIANGDQTFTKLNNGVIMGFGENFNGQLGDASNAPRPSAYPVDMTGALDPTKNISKISTGLTHTIVIQNGELFAWGGNEAYGQLGDGSGMDRYVPDKVYTGGDLFEKVIVDVVAGYHHNLALSSTGELFTWGHGSYGFVFFALILLIFFSQLGDYATHYKILPQSLINIKAAKPFTVPLQKVFAGPYTSFGLTMEGKLYRYGSISYLFIIY